ncbi:hypothetical protein P4I85_13485 [Bacillus cereus]|uniref:hypothetical protein n=1 Tax=Bacillus thuringiensis TaxID=1428 RepID=UPI001298954E|nr:hypothetical protein [Bacillus thuringiensis]MEB9514112.1 hypothetical protein [Bacillus cereus]MEB9561500.1 hypothetical protein [Bacillus cereus]MRC02827.1 hypothetical protein [Bacillus thuringiensis]HDX9674054.1 hypothetical protein [Bacillus cereus]
MSNPTQPRIGIRKNFMRESQAAELENNDKIVILDKKADKGIETVDLILEPDKLDQLSSKCRLTMDEYCGVINTLIEEEESEWDDLRMKDQINITRDGVLQATILKYAKEEYGIDKDNYNGTDFNYIKRYDKQGGFLGEAMVLSLTAIQMMNMKVNY